MRIFLGILVILLALQTKAEQTCSQLFNKSAPSAFKLPDFKSPTTKLPSQYKTSDLEARYRNAFLNLAPTVTIKDSTADENGNSIYILEKINFLPWRSEYKEGRNDLQGDPRTFSMILGPKVAQKFGFRSISENQMTAPSAEAFNSYIRRMNIKLNMNRQEVIRIMFYETGDKLLSDLEYLQRFAYEARLPLAKSGNLAIHDISYHTLSILLQNNLIMPARKTAQFILELNSRLETDPLLSPNEKQIAKQFMEDIIGKFVSSLDVGTGNLVVIMNVANKDLFEHSLSRLKDLPKLINLSGLSDYLQNFIYYKSRRPSENLQKAFLKNYVATTSKILNENQSNTEIPSILKNLITNFKAWAKVNPIEMNMQSEHKLINELNARILLLQKLSEGDSN
ncbi:MAG: hypothetical protein V4596_10430 [Bdellovibrionota bacterium]